MKITHIHTRIHTQLDRYYQRSKRDMNILKKETFRERINESLENKYTMLEMKTSVIEMRDKAEETSQEVE